MGIKPYHEEIIPVIRQHSNNIIILGTRTWSQEVGEASKDPVAGYSNLAYTLHFYASTHKGELRRKAQEALNNGLALFVTEWGACSASGNGELDFEEAQKWLDFLQLHKISDANWAISDKRESCAALLPGSNPHGGWTLSTLSDSGKFMRTSIRASRPTPWPMPTPEPEPEPMSCEDLPVRMNLTHAGQQCNSFTDKVDCMLGFISRGYWAIPCAWTECGCIADGSYLFECPL